MKNKLIETKNSKEIISKNKIILTDYFEKKFPNLFCKDPEKIEKDINENLQILLCSSLKNKTSRIKIERPIKDYYGNNNYLSLTRKGCLNYEHRDYGIDLFETEKQSLILDKNWDLRYTDNEYNKSLNGKINIRFSILKGHELIDKEKLATVIRLREAAIRIQEDSSIRWTRKRKADDSIFKITDKFSLRFYSESVDFEFTDYNHSGYNSINHENLEELDSKSLETIFRTWNKVNQKLSEGELIKDKTIKGYNKILKELKNKNRAFLVLESLTKKI